MSATPQSKNRDTRAPTCVVASGIFYLRTLAEAGIPVGEAARQIGIALAVDADFFLGVAKLRALRRLWGRVLEVAGVRGAMATLRLHAATATRMLSRRDPYVNILRGTVATFAAAGSYASAQAFADGFQPAILVAGGLSAAGAITGLALPGRRAAADALPVGAVPAYEAET